MANIFKFRVTTKVKDTLGLGIGSYEAGSTIYLNEKQLNTAAIRNAIQQGYVEPMGEDDSQITDIMLDYYNAVQGFNKNFIPVSTIELVSPKAAAGLVDTQATDLAGDVVLGRRVAIDKIMARWSIASVASAMPRLLVTSGISGIVTPTLLTSYTYLTGAYLAATNGSIAAAAAPITWAASDMLIIGYSEKFASVVTDRSAANTVATTATAYYWNGTTWVAFNTTTDHTIETTGKTLSRTHAADKSRIIWWEMPDAWIPGGPAGSGALHTDYCVAIKFSAALTTLAGCSVYPVLDRPIADINLGYGEFAPTAVVLKLAAAYTNIIAVSPAAFDNFTTTDYIWVGFTQPVSGFYVTVSTVNTNHVDHAVTYWNGQSWISIAATDGTDNTGTFGKSGAITLSTIPQDWVPAVATNIAIGSGGSGTSTPATVSTASLYWIRYTVSAAMDNDVDATINRGVPGLNHWYSYETVEMSYVDANDPIKVIVVEPENIIATLTLNAVMEDL